MKTETIIKKMNKKLDLLFDHIDLSNNSIQLELEDEFINIERDLNTLEYLINKYK